MKEVQRNTENRIRVWGAKKMALQNNITALQQLVLQRFQALIALSSIAFAVTGVVMSVRSDLIQNPVLAVLAAILFVCIALVGVGRHLYLIRNDICDISKRIRELPDADWNQPLEEKEFKADWWPETLYGLLILGVLLFGLSLIYPLVA